MSRLRIPLKTPCKKCGSTNRVSILSILGRRHHCLDCHHVYTVKTPEQYIQARKERES